MRSRRTDKTIQQWVIESFQTTPAQVMTAQELLNDINGYGYLTEVVRLDSLSSKLRKMVDDGLLLRVDGYGPRGGYGYMLNPNCKELNDP